MQLIDLDAKIIVPITDETKGGMVYETEMTVAELFARFLPDYQPEIVNAIPMGWMEMLQAKMIHGMFSESIAGAIDVILMRWQEEQEVRQ